MTILITGVAGLIGSQFAKWLIKNTAHKVVGVDDLSGGYIQNVDHEVIFHKFDCANRNEMDAVFEKHNPDIVYHFAAYAAEGLSPFIRTFNYTNNLVATANIVNCCINFNVQRLVFTSSMAVYGKGIPPFSESDHLRPCDPYGVAKYSCEQDIRCAGDQHGLDWCIIRPHNVYGPGQNIWDRYRNVLGIWMNQHLNGKKLTIFGDGQQQRAFSYIDDILHPMYDAGVEDVASKEIINLGGIEHTRLVDAANLLIEVMGGGEIEHLEARHEVKNAYSTHRKSIELLGYKEYHPLRQGLEKMWAWAKYQPGRDVKKMEYEVKKGIYQYWK